MSKLKVVVGAIAVTGVVGYVLYRGCKAIYEEHKENVKEKIDDIAESLTEDDEEFKHFDYEEVRNEELDKVLDKFEEARERARKKIRERLRKTNKRNSHCDKEHQKEDESSVIEGCGRCDGKGNIRGKGKCRKSLYGEDTVNEPEEIYTGTDDFNDCDKELKEPDFSHFNAEPDEQEEAYNDFNEDYDYQEPDELPDEGSDDQYGFAETI